MAAPHWCFAESGDPGVGFLAPVTVAGEREGGPLLPIELLVQKKDQQVDVNLCFIE